MTILVQPSKEPSLKTYHGANLFYISFQKVFSSSQLFNALISKSAILMKKVEGEEREWNKLVTATRKAFFLFKKTEYQKNSFMFASESGDQKSVESNSNSSTSTTIAAIPCKGCGKKANFLIVLDDDELECACGEPWEVPLDWYYCSKRCYSKNSYWMLQGSSLLVQDECNGCGCPQFFAVGVTMVPITREMIEDYAKEKSSSEEEETNVSSTPSISNSGESITPKLE